MIFKAMTLNEFIREIRKIFKDRGKFTRTRRWEKGKNFQEAWYKQRDRRYREDLQFWREMGQIRRQSVSEFYKIYMMEGLQMLVKIRSSL